MIAPAFFLAVVVLVAWNAVRSWAAVEERRILLKHAENSEVLRLDRDRFEATRPVAPHEELVAKVAVLESRINSVEAWAKR